MLALKAVRQRHQASDQLLLLLDEFRRMVNFCIIVGIEQNISSLMTLTPKTYPRLTKNMLGYYRVCAISVATRILKTYRNAKRKNPFTAFPQARKLMLTTCYGFKIEDGFLRLPVKPGTHVKIRLNAHTLRALSDANARSVTITPSTVSVSYRREVAGVKPEGWVGVDLNLNNVTTASTDHQARTFDLSEVTVIKRTYRHLKRRLRRNDSRIRRVVYRKFGMRQSNRVKPLLHNVSRALVNDAKARRFGIVMERLTGMRRVYRKDNGQSRDYRAAMNSWSYAELQRQIEYKARWEGIRVVYVSARNTSKLCSICGFKTLESTQRQLWCPKCRAILDRDDNAARNIAARGARFTPDGPPFEAMVEEREPRNATLIPKVDGGKSTHRAKG